MGVCVGVGVAVAEGEDVGVCEGVAVADIVDEGVIVAVALGDAEGDGGASNDASPSDPRSVVDAVISAAITSTSSTALDPSRSARIDTDRRAAPPARTALATPCPDIFALHMEMGSRGMRH